MGRWRIIVVFWSPCYKKVPLVWHKNWLYYFKLFDNVMYYKFHDNVMFKFFLNSGRTGSHGVTLGRTGSHVFAPPMECRMYEASVVSTRFDMRNILLMWFQECLRQRQCRQRQEEIRNGSEDCRWIDCRRIRRLLPIKNACNLFPSIISPAYLAPHKIWK